MYLFPVKKAKAFSSAEAHVLSSICPSYNIITKRNSFLKLSYFVKLGEHRADTSNVQHYTVTFMQSSSTTLATPDLLKTISYYNDNLL